MAKVLMIVAQKNFRDEELLIPKEMLETEGHEVVITSLSRYEATGMLGAKVTPKMAVHEANPSFFDAIVVVGGSGSPALAQSEDVLKLLQNAEKQGKIISAICLGPMALAKAGVLAGRKATIFKTEDSLQALKDGGASYTGEDVTVEGKLVTASGPQAANEFARALIDLLKE
jgi:protease I